MTAVTGARTRGRVRRLVLVALAAVIAAGWWSVHRDMPGWYARMWYPLHHDAVVNAQSERHGLDPALVAAVVNVESGWTPDATSPAGAVGLMQMLPATAEFIARQPDRPSPAPDRLTDPEVSIAYGTWYLRYLLNRHDDVPAALAAYNAGEQNVRRWEGRAEAQGRDFDRTRDIAFPETRSFVEKVLRDAGRYRRAYGDDLGPPVAGLARLPGTSRSLGR